MPNKHKTLTSLFTDIAGAIRSKTGGSAKIKADDFDTAIKNIPGEFTTNQLLGVDPIDRLRYYGTTLPKYGLYRKTINNLSLPNLTTISNSSLAYTSTSSDLNTLFSKVERIEAYGLQSFNENITLTSDYNVVFPKLTYIEYSSFQNFGWGSYSIYSDCYYSNYNNPKYNIILPLLTSSSYEEFIGYSSLYKVRNLSARNFMGKKNICYNGYSLGTVDIKGWTTAPTSTAYSDCLVYNGYNLRTIVIRNSTMCPAASNPDYMWNSAYFMTGTVNSDYNPNGEHGVIYVPDNLVNTYKNDANWRSCFDVNYIKPLSKYVDPYESYYQGE